MDLTFKNGRGEVFPHTTESWAETIELARLNGLEIPETLTPPRPGDKVPDAEARTLADALERAVREDLGEHSVMADFAALLRGGGVYVEAG